jgi:hypothetical protein
MGFQNLTAIQAAIRAGQVDRAFWNKAFSSSNSGSFRSMWATAGFPAAGSYPGSALAAALQDNTTPGALAFATVPAGKSRHLFSGSVGMAAAAGGASVVILLDRLLVYPGIAVNTNSLQTFTNPVSLSRYVGGVGVMAFIEVSTLLSAGTSTSGTLIYTNQDGGSSTSVITGVTNSNQGVTSVLPLQKMYLPLQAGDTGIRSLTSFQLAGTTHTSGAMAIVLAKPIAMFWTNIGIWEERDMVAQVPQLEQIMDGACLMIALQGSAITTTLFGQVETVFG